MDAPAAQAAISAAAGTADDLGEPDPDARTVQCEGPEAELRLLGSICGDRSDVSYDYLSPDGLGAVFGADEAAFPIPDGPRFLLYGLVDELDGTDRASQMSYAAFVLLDSSSVPENANELAYWSDAEPVAEGVVVTETATGDACGDGWVGSGTFLWRSTTIRVSWQGGHGC